MEFETIIRNIVREEFAGNASVPSPPELISPAELHERHKIFSRDMIYDLVRNASTNKFPCVRLGHASVVMTLDTYSHVLPHIQDAATDVMDSILNARSI